MGSMDLTQTIPSGAWTLYFHSLREKRWTIETFQKIATVTSIGDVLSVFKELDEKIKGGMYFWMKDPLPPLWENYHNIRGGSYSVRGGHDVGIELYKKYVLGTMMNMAAVNPADSYVGVSISPKILGVGPSQ